MVMNTTEEVRTYLLQSGILDDSRAVEITPLGGGVSNNVWKILTGDHRWILKQALPKLKVEDDWFSDVERIHREHTAMQLITGLLPERTVPHLVLTDHERHLYIMEAAGESSRTWKEILMQGDFDRLMAMRAGEVLGRLHRSSVFLSEADKELLADQQYFQELRIEPFHEHLIRKYPELERYIMRLIDDVTLRRSCFVHGDFSPKNILIEDKGNLVLIDYEVAHWGNPVFDLAYCIAHLMLKGWHLNKKEEAITLVMNFLSSYDGEAERLIPHLGLMLLARMDGKSPVDYIRQSVLKATIREVAVRCIMEEKNIADIQAYLTDAMAT